MAQQEHGLPIHQTPNVLHKHHTTGRVVRTVAPPDTPEEARFEIPTACRNRIGAAGCEPDRERGMAVASVAPLVSRAQAQDGRMKVLYLAPPASDSSRLAAFTFLDEEIQALARSGVEVHLLTASITETRSSGEIHLFPIRPGSSLRERARTLRFLGRVGHLLPSGSLAQFRHAFHALRLEQCAADLIVERGIDVVHSHFGHPFGLGGRLAAVATGRPLVASFRGMDLLLAPEIDYGLRRSAFYDRALRALLGSADATTYVSDFLRDWGIRLGAGPSRAVTIRKGVDLDRFRPVAERNPICEALGIKPPMVLTVAGLIRRKGVDTLLRAAALAIKKSPFTLVVCGEGQEAERLKALAVELALGEQARFVGTIARDRIASYFAAAELFVLPSRLEASGNVLVEAMAAGRPVVCTDSGGPPEYVGQGKAGFVVPVDDAEAMAERIHLLLTDGELRERLGAQARAAAEHEHAYDVMINRIVATYERALARRLQPA
jgi:glycosyltransferase involved in cell wall biosynthesis